VPLYPYNNGSQPTKIRIAKLTLQTEGDYYFNGKGYFPTIPHETAHADPTYAEIIQEFQQEIEKQKKDQEQAEETKQQAQTRINEIYSEIKALIQSQITALESSFIIITPEILATEQEKQVQPEDLQPYLKETNFEKFKDAGGTKTAIPKGDDTYMPYLSSVSLQRVEDISGWDSLSDTTYIILPKGYNDQRTCEDIKTTIEKDKMVGIFTGLLEKWAGISLNEVTKSLFHDQNTEESKASEERESERKTKYAGAKKAGNYLAQKGYYKLVPHILEGDKDGFFAGIFSKGVYLYEEHPHEYYTIKLERGKYTNTLLVGGNPQVEIYKSSYVRRQDGTGGNIFETLMDQANRYRNHSYEDSRNSDHKNTHGVKGANKIIAEQIAEGNRSTIKVRFIGELEIRQGQDDPNEIGK
ncbi:18401_t:CDS:2, partial [Funneliformis geosporum]